MTSPNVAFRRLAAAALAIGGLAACSKDDGPTVTQQPDLAFVRVINAIPDTGAMIYGFRDQPENPLEGSGLSFRQATAYKGTAVGQRLLRAFAVSNNPAIVAGEPILNNTITLRANQYYTILHVGLAQGNRDSIIVLEDAIPSNSTLGANVGIRAIHAAPTVGAVNVFVTNVAADPLPSTSAGTLNYGGASGYITRAAGPANARVQVVASPTTVLSVQMQPGTAGTDQLNPEGGVTIAGSSMSVVAFPAGLGARAAGAGANPALVSFLDGRPANTVTPIRP